MRSEIGMITSACSGDHPGLRTPILRSHSPSLTLGVFTLERSDLDERPDIDAGAAGSVEETDR